MGRAVGAKAVAGVGLVIELKAGGFVRVEGTVNPVCLPCRRVEMVQCDWTGFYQS